MFLQFDIDPVITVCVRFPFSLTHLFHLIQLFIEVERENDEIESRFLGLYDQIEQFIESDSVNGKGLLPQDPFTNDLLRDILSEY